MDISLPAILLLMRIAYAMSMVGPGGIGIALCLIRVQLVRYDRYI